MSLCSCHKLHEKIVFLPSKNSLWANFRGEKNHYNLYHAQQFVFYLHFNRILSKDIWERMKPIFFLGFSGKAICLYRVPPQLEITTYDFKYVSSSINNLNIKYQLYYCHPAGFEKVPLLSFIGDGNWHCLRTDVLICL